MLPKDYNARKRLPLYSFLTSYFPDAIIEIVKVAVAGNVQHNPGEPLHWAREKSTDQLNTAMRHIFDHGMGQTYDTEPPEVLAAIGPAGTMHLAKAAWRLLAQIQLICEEREPDSGGVRCPACGTIQGDLHRSGCAMMEYLNRGNIQREEGCDAPRLGEGAGSAYHASRHQEGSLAWPAGGEARELRPDGEAPL